MTSRRDVILVTGATGRIGQLVVDELVLSGARVRALTRRPEDMSFPAGVEVVSGDFTIPETLGAALDDVSTVFLVWTTTPDAAPAAVARLASHTRRVVYLSAPFRTPHPFFQQPNPMRELHAEVERLLADATLDVTVLRPGMFATNALHWWAPQIRQSDVVRWPFANVETAPVDERDVAAVAARTLLDNRHAGGDYVLTGPESLSHAAQVRTIGSVIGRQLRFEELSSEEFRREAEGTWPPGVADMLLNAWQAALGRPAYVTSTVKEILGSPPRTFEQWAVDHAAAFLA